MRDIANLTLAKQERLSHDCARDIISYDPISGVVTLMASRRVDLVGKPCGTKRPNGYLVVALRLKGKKVNLYLHRLIWFWMTGAWPASEIDHINGVRDDNRWENLREATVSQNRRNSGARRDSHAKLKGVKTRTESPSIRVRFIAAISVNKKTIQLGAYDCPAAAHFVYLIAAEKYFGEFARGA